jgi:hypothetical protein
VSEERKCSRGWVESPIANNNNNIKQQQPTPLFPLPSSVVVLHMHHQSSKVRLTGSLRAAEGEEDMYMKGSVVFVGKSSMLVRCEVVVVVVVVEGGWWVVGGECFFVFSFGCNVSCNSCSSTGHCCSLTLVCDNPTHPSLILIPT